MKYDFIILTNNITSAQNSKIKYVFNTFTKITNLKGKINPDDKHIDCKVLLYFDNTREFNINQNINYLHKSLFSFVNIEDIDETHTCIDILQFTIAYELFCKDNRFKVIEYRKSSGRDAYLLELFFKNGELSFRLNKNTSKCICRFGNDLYKYNNATNWAYMHDIYPDLFTLNGNIYYQ